MIEVCLHQIGTIVVIRLTVLVRIRHIQFNVNGILSFIGVSRTVVIHKIGKTIHDISFQSVSPEISFCFRIKVSIVFLVIFDGFVKFTKCHLHACQRVACEALYNYGHEARVSYNIAILQTDDIVFIIENTVLRILQYGKLCRVVGCDIRAGLWVLDASQIGIGAV